ncbi:hypothetical protein TNCV_3156331 [Trichonephila clavipes]|nr:hypothetical protein TNCV_3156331 [Trichonephila clavipes]
MDPRFLRQIDFQTKGLDEAIPERVYLTEMRKNSNPKEDISLTLTVTKNNFLENIIDISNNYVKLIRVEVSHAENWLIHSLHEREFYEEMRKLLAGTLVLIKDENLPSTKWSTGRITEIFPGTDGKQLRLISGFETLSLYTPPPATAGVMWRVRLGSRVLLGN